VSLWRALSLVGLPPPPPPPTHTHICPVDSKNSTRALQHEHLVSSIALVLLGFSLQGHACVQYSPAFLFSNTHATSGTASSCLLRPRGNVLTLTYSPRHRTRRLGCLRCTRDKRGKCTLARGTSGVAHVLSRVCRARAHHKWGVLLIDIILPRTCPLVPC
jgi:hypothetical protein